MDKYLGRPFCLYSICFSISFVSALYEDFEDENDTTVKYLWQAIENFTNGMLYFY